MSKFLRGPLIYILIIVLIIISAQYLSNPAANSQPQTLEYYTFLSEAKDGKIQDVAIRDQNLYGRYQDSKIPKENFPGSYDFTTYVPSVLQLNEDLAAISGTNDPLGYSIKVTYLAPEEQNILISLLPYIILVVLMILMFVFIMRQAKAGGAGNAMTFGKSRARMTMGGESKKTFRDVAGADEEKEELQEIVQFLKAPKSFMELGARIPKGVLLVGPPGGGKTLLAKAVAGEAGVPFFSISGSDFVEMFVGVGASRVRDLFNDAKKNSPCIIFIDEIDAVGRQRGAGLGGGHDEREQTLNQLLVEMDGFEVNEGIIIMAATNRKDILDPALLRPGRFDRQIVVNYPDVRGREEILQVHSRGKPFEPEVDMKVIARRTPGFIGADLENVLNEAAILTARRKKAKISMSEIEEAITRVIAGPEKKSRLVTEKDKRCTAFHEVGHAILAYNLPGCDPVHEVSVIPRGMAAGYTMTLPKEDKQHIFKSKLLDEITMMLGGRVAELLVLEDISTGAVNDLQRATEVAREMVTKYGMSDELGPVFLSDKHEVFLGREFGQQSAYSEETAAKVDAEVKKILESAYAKAKELLSTNKDKLLTISEVLIAKEKLSGSEFEELYEKGKLSDEAAEEKNTPEPENNVLPFGGTPGKASAPREGKNQTGSFDEGYDPN